MRARITALACSEAPDRPASWTLRLLADRAIELGIVATISHRDQEDTEKNDLKPHLKKQWCIGRITGEYLARMEEVLRLYNLPYDEKRPVVCFDELPVQLIDDLIEPMPMKTGKPKRID
jgi:hypothetical protein